METCRGISGKKRAEMRKERKQRRHFSIGVELKHRNKCNTKKLLLRQPNPSINRPVSTVKSSSV